MTITKQQFIDNFDKCLEDFITGAAHYEFAFISFYDDADLSSRLSDADKKQWLSEMDSLKNWEETIEEMDYYKEDVAAWCIDNKSEIKSEFIDYFWSQFNSEVPTEPWWETWSEHFPT